MGAPAVTCCPSVAAMSCTVPTRGDARRINPPSGDTRPATVSTSGIGEHGSVVLAYVDDDEDSAGVYQLIDALWEEGLGGLLLLPDVDERRARLGGKGVIVMQRDTDPTVIAAALYALVERQATATCESSSSPLRAHAIAIPRLRPGPRVRPTPTILEGWPRGKAPGC